MREIKFRGKAWFGGEWHYGLLAKGTGDYTYIKSGHVGVRVAPETVGQFIGLTTDEDKEIYEGDVLEAIYKYEALGPMGGVIPDQDCLCKGVVEYDTDLLQWVLRIIMAEHHIKRRMADTGETSIPLWEFDHWWGESNPNLEVIGNIHDNPELIKN